MLALSALALYACQPTPEKEIVVNKGGDILDAVESQTPAETGNEGENTAVESENKLKDRSFPGHYSYEAKSENGLLTLMVDADVVLPASGKLPVATMEAAGFSREMAKAMVRCLFPDGLPMDTQYIMTKSDIEARILDYQREIETWRESDEEYAADAIAQYEEYIAELEAEYESAPEERPPATTTDGTYHTMSDGSLRLECSAQGRGHLFVLTGEAAHGAQIWYVNSTTNFTLDGAPEVDESFVPGKEYEGKLALPAADAIALAEGFLEACGRDDIVLANIYIADDHGTDTLMTITAPRPCTRTSCSSLPR